MTLMTSYNVTIGTWPLTNLWINSSGCLHCLANPMKLTWLKTFHPHLGEFPRMVQVFHCRTEEISEMEDETLSTKYSVIRFAKQNQILQWSLTSGSLIQAGHTFHI